MTQQELDLLVNDGHLNLQDFSNQELFHLDFKACHLEKVSFDNCHLLDCNFDNCTLEKVSFRKAQLTNCRFRRANIHWSDFRYTEIEKATFEESVIDFCDFYRSMMGGIIIMRHARISNTSLYYTYFGDGVNIRKDNIVNGILLQQDKESYRKFLTEWHLNGTGARRNDIHGFSAWSPEKSLQDRWADAEEIYKNLNGLWQGRGFMRDSNWAYVQGRRMERKRMMREWTSCSTAKKIEYGWKILSNAMMDLMFGFGENMLRMVLTYIILVLLFAYIFFGEASLPSYLEALWISLKNMAGVGSEELNGISPFIDMLNVLQTTFGILLTGIFGFILGNKIRNQ